MHRIACIEVRAVVFRTTRSATALRTHGLRTDGSRRINVKVCLLASFARDIVLAVSGDAGGFMTIVPTEQGMHVDTWGRVT